MKPQGWRLLKIRYSFKMIGSGTTPDTSRLDYYDGEVPWLTSSELRESVITSTAKTISKLAMAEYSALRLYPEGSLAIAMYGATMGRLGILGLSAAVNQACLVLAYPIFLNPRFTFYSLLAQRDNILRQAEGGGQQNLNAQTLCRVEVMAPDLPTQQAIAAFLDLQTSRIDALMGKKQRLIELLDEKRAALISHAVTQGLDPTVPMKDSGIDWLGRIPGNWKEHRLSAVADFISGSTPTIDRLDYWGGDIPWASAKDMKVSYLAQTEDHITETALREWGMRLLRPPAVLLVVRGMILLHSLPVAVSQVPMTINQDMKALSVRSSLCVPEFMMRWFQGSKHGIAGLIEQSAHGTRCLRTDLLKRMKCFLPGLEEQAQICNYITAKSDVLEATGNHLSAAIDRLREYRSALITAAVTGQLDLREHETKMEALA